MFDTGPFEEAAGNLGVIVIQASLYAELLRVEAAIADDKQNPADSEPIKYLEAIAVLYRPAEA